MPGVLSSQSSPPEVRPATRPASVRPDRARSASRAEFAKHPDAACAEITASLTAPRAWLSPKFFYDGLGSRLFDTITALPEYYPTRVEAEILATHQHDIARRIGERPVMIDLGAGNCQKAARLFPALRPAQYVPVDISVEYLRDTLEGLQRQFPEIAMQAVGADLSTPFDFPSTVGRDNRLFFYPGSSIGNFTPIEALALLQRIRAASARGDGVLIGVDLLKSVETLEDAYDDPLGVTAAFNLNILRHVNRLAGADFEVGDWQHIALFNAAHNRIEMHLQARRDVTVTWSGGTRRFLHGERIHTESSYKYRDEDFALLLEQAGFDDICVWHDRQDAFAVFHARG
ncbi:L-histidine N(alpha)-methyltransferase [Imbroritus primus]|uniref:L-histidine N(alpha)-methyltransferase n=1 Tax=Imbroritus primus TaxID=3058603 RepID=UPI003D161871